MNRPPVLSLEALFDPGVADGLDLLRHERPLNSVEGTLTLEAVGPTAIACATVVVHGPVSWSIPPDWNVTPAPDGGYVLQHRDAARRTFAYWVPLAPRHVQRDANGRLLAVTPAVIAELVNANGGIDLSFASGAHPLELIVWQLPPGWAAKPPCGLERSRWQTLGSHTLLNGRVGLYEHLVGGTVFENRVAWPNDWRVFSENDAHSLRLTLHGLAVAADDEMLQAMCRQIVLSVLARQAADGGFHHGEWTSLMESHYRLHCSAMHLMMDALAERPDAAVANALGDAARFLARQAVHLRFGNWLLHDELEHSVDKMKLGPFKWVPSTVFGKAESNMLVLNSHLDATVALDRYAETTGDTQYAALVDSAREATRAVLGCRPAETLYRAVFWLVELTFLPARRAAALPLWKRALKRLTWKALIPRLPDLKARFPRWVMPGGYIDRELTLRTWAHDYHAINLMDLARYLRRFDEPLVREVLLQGLAFTRRSGILDRWREMSYHKYALGFWVEALYHVCTLLPDASYRQWLAEGMLVLEDLKMGQPPSLLGTNAEAIPVAEQLPCPIPADPRLRVANLGRRGSHELLLVNATDLPLPIVWETAPTGAVAFHIGGELAAAGPAQDVPARGWLWGRAAQ